MKVKTCYLLGVEGDRSSYLPLAILIRNALGLAFLKNTTREL
jgi:hypothetical protein